MAFPERLDVLGMFNGAVGVHPARVVDVLRLEQQDPDLFFGDGPVLDALGHDDDLSGPTSTFRSRNSMVIRPRMTWNSSSCSAWACQRNSP